MKGVFQEAVNVFKAQRKKINNHYKALTQEDKLQQQCEKAVELPASSQEAGALQWKQTKSMAAQVCKSKAPAPSPTVRHHPRPPPFHAMSSDSEDAALTEEDEEEEDVTQMSTESSVEMSAGEAVAGPSWLPTEGVRRSSRLAKLL